MTLLLAGRKGEAAAVSRKGQAVTHCARRRSRGPFTSLRVDTTLTPVAVSSPPTAQENYYLCAPQPSSWGLANRARAPPAGHRDESPISPRRTRNSRRISRPKPSRWKHWREVIRLGSNNATALRRAAWILATHSHPAQWTRSPGAGGSRVAVDAVKGRPRRSTRWPQPMPRTIDSRKPSRAARRRHCRRSIARRRDRTAHPPVSSPAKPWRED